MNISGDGVYLISNDYRHFSIAIHIYKLYRIRVCKIPLSNFKNVLKHI